MEQYKWAENEVRLACLERNPNYNFDAPTTEDTFDYGCECSRSALKVYKMMCDENSHSGSSFEIMMGILNSLCRHRPLTPIYDEDFFQDNGVVMPKGPEEYLTNSGLISSIQCPRMSSLFRDEHQDGTVTYHDISRYINIDAECHSNRYHGDGRIIDSLFPIMMPYMPKSKPYEIYEQRFLTDRKFGDFDTYSIIYIMTPDGRKIDINKYFTETGGGGWKEITRGEYEELLEKRLDPLNVKVAGRICMILSEYVVGSEEERFEIDTKTRSAIEEACLFFNLPFMWKYNTYQTLHWVCGDTITIDASTVKKFEKSRTLVRLKEKISSIVSEICSGRAE